MGFTAESMFDIYWKVATHNEPCICVDHCAFMQWLPIDYAFMQLRSVTRLGSLPKGPSGDLNQPPSDALTTCLPLAVIQYSADTSFFWVSGCA